MKAPEMGAEARWHEYPGRRRLAEGLADTVAEMLREAIAKRGHATIAVSGGSTPGSFFRALAVRKLDWASVTVTLVDERYVPPDSQRSNERLVTLNLLHGPAAAAEFVGLFSAASDVATAARTAGESLAELPLPLDVAVLGMGADGHTASFFADADNLRILLDPAGDDLVCPVVSSTAGEPRLTLSLGLLVQARHIILHIEGLEKKERLLDAIAGIVRLPVSAVFEHAPDAIDIYWAPSGETP